MLSFAAKSATNSADLDAAAKKENPQEQEQQYTKTSATQERWFETSGFLQVHL